MTKACIVFIMILVLLAVVLMVGQAPAQQQGGQGQPAAGAPTAPMGGPASGPPGMALPKDIVKGDTPKAVNTARSSKVIWIIAGVVILGVIVAYVISRKQAG